MTREATKVRHKKLVEGDWLSSAAQWVNSTYPDEKGEWDLTIHSEQFPYLL